MEKIKSINPKNTMKKGVKNRTVKTSLAEIDMLLKIQELEAKQDQKFEQDLLFNKRIKPFVLITKDFAVLDAYDKMINP